MAGGLHHRNGAGRRSYKPMAEINVTPMVDVMLVLLVVFMVAAPLLTVGVPVDLPKSQAPAINENKEQIEIAITAVGHIHIQKTPIEANALVDKLQAITEQQSRPGDLCARRHDDQLRPGHGSDGAAGQSRLHQAEPDHRAAAGRREALGRCSEPRPKP